MKESKYVRLAYIIYRVLRNSRIPLFLHRKSNHVFSLWQHIVLLTVRQYEGKSYRLFVEWLVEAYYLRMFLQLSHIPHYPIGRISITNYVFQAMELGLTRFFLTLVGNLSTIISSIPYLPSIQLISSFVLFLLDLLLDFYNFQNA